MSDVVVIAQSGLTAVTAYCAFQAVRLSKERWRTAKDPDIHLQILLAREAQTTDLALVNIGGWARGALVAMSVGDQRASSYLGDSLIAPGERLYVHTELPQSEDTKVLLLYRGIDETSYRVLRGKARELSATIVTAPRPASRPSGRVLIPATLGAARRRWRSRSSR